MVKSLTEISTRCATLSMLEEGILHVRLVEDSEISLEDSKAMFMASMEITEGKKFVTLIDARAKVVVSKESREWGSKPEAQKNMIAQAIVVDSLANRIVGNFIIKFHKPIAKTRLFSDEKSALAWLRAQKSIYLR